ncbi:MAG: CocE/NonD family hydrolase [Anaerolineae bacterium]
MPNSAVPPAIRVQMELETPMRDGVVLRGDLYRPTTGNRFPVLLLRTYYDNQSPLYVDWAGRFARAGYAVFLQDVRGRYDSDGLWRPYIDEAQDGYDTQEWIGRQPWCDGNIGTFGISYNGFTATLPTPLGSPYLKAVMPLTSQEDNYGHLRNRGVLELWNAVNLLAMGRRTMASNLWRSVDIEAVWRRLPLVSALDDIADRPVYRQCVEHETFDDTWKSYSLKGRYRNMCVPAYIVTGWYDNLLHEGFKQYQGWSTQAATDEARGLTRLLVGPWTHYHLGGGVDYGADLRFGPQDTMDMPAEHLHWFDRRLRGIDTGIDSEPPLRMFVMGANVWRCTYKWPLPETHFTPLYLHGGGHANSLMGDGRLDWAKPGDAPADHFAYDPSNPVPSWGGQIQPPWLSGPRDRRSIEQRTDVLVYTSEPLQESVEVTGPVELVLHAVTSAPDTDWTAALVDVHPDGKAIVLCEGILRARFRASVETPTPVQPGVSYAYRVNLWETSNLFRVGHRIRLEVSSSNFPRFDRNLNTGHPSGMDDTMAVAEQTVYHDAQRASHLILPVIPAPFGSAG